MPAFLEYDINSGKILCFLSGDNPPAPAEGFALLEIDDNLNIDTSCYAVREGQLVKLFESNAERAERERLKREHYEEVRKRLHSMIHECVLAILDDNQDAVHELQNEFKTLKAYM